MRVLFNIILVVTLLRPAQLDSVTQWYFDSCPPEVTGFLLGGLRPRARQLYEQQ